MMGNTPRLNFYMNFFYTHNAMLVWDILYFLDFIGT